MIEDYEYYLDRSQKVLDCVSLETLFDIMDTDEVLVLAFLLEQGYFEESELEDNGF